MLDKAKAGIKITRRNSNNLRNIDEVIAHLMRLLLILSPLWQKARKSKRLLLKVKDESKKIGLKFNIQKTKIMASGRITSWETDGETVEIVSDYFGGVPKSLQMVIAAMKLKDAYSLEGKL